ncbi:MAG TPA: hypothetical protein VKB34_19460, partial [Povalibacter sp.]|nr:hypothetical protein [Povalibacter sp.]
IARLSERTPRDAALEHSRLLLATHMLVAAARRRQSCGAHYRSDAREITALSDGLTTAVMADLDQGLAANSAVAFPA